MEPDIVAIARASMDAFSRREFEAALAPFDPDIVWDVARQITPDAGTSRGHEGVRRFWNQWHDTFARFELEIVECRAVDDERVIAITRARGTGAESGLEVASGEFAQIFHFRGSTVVKVEIRPGRAVGR